MISDFREKSRSNSRKSSIKMQKIPIDGQKSAHLLPLMSAVTFGVLAGQIPDAHLFCSSGLKSTKKSQSIDIYAVVVR